MLTSGGLITDLLSMPPLRLLRSIFRLRVDSVLRVDCSSRSTVVPALDDFPSCRELEKGVAHMSGQVAGRHRHLAFVGLGEIAGHPVQIYRELARGLGVEE